MMLSCMKLPAVRTMSRCVLHKVNQNDPKMTSKLNPPFALDIDGPQVDNGPDSPGFRSGGPKEARLKRVALLSLTKEVEHLHPVRIDNIPKTTKVENLRLEFSEFGEIGDVYIPTNLKDRTPAKDFAVIRFTDKKVAEKALSSPEKTANKTINGTMISVSPMAKQDSFFSNNTGRLGIANEICITHVPPKKEVVQQIISLASVRSRSGYPWGSVRELKYLNPKPSSDVIQYHSLKLLDLPKYVTEEQLYDMFSKYGEIGVVSCPKPIIVTQQTGDANMGHAFVRYKDRRDLVKAADDIADEKLEIDGHVLKAEIIQPLHWPTDKTRRYY